MSRDDTDQLRRLEAVADAQLAELGHDELLSEMLDRVRAVLHVDTVAVLVTDDNDDPSTLIAFAARGLEEEVRLGVRVPIGVGFAGRVAATRSPVVLDHVGPDVAVNPLLWRRGIRCMLGVPLLATGRLVGVMHVGSVTDRPFTEDDVEVLTTAAERVAGAVAIGRSTADRSAAKILQRSLLPSRLPSVPGLQLAARYVAAGEFVVGGDWYDAFVLPDGRVGLGIGDVTGSGLRAAGVMGRMRSVLRGFALEIDEPAAVLERLNRTFTYFEPNEMATVCYGTVDLERRTFTVASSGHLPPVVAVDGRAPELVALRPGPPIGSGVPGRPEDIVVDLPAGATITLYTDGLVERRDRSIMGGLDALRDAIGVGSAEDVVHAIVEELIEPRDASDDTAVLVARIGDDVA